MPTRLCLYYVTPRMNNRGSAPDSDMVNTWTVEGSNTTILHASYTSPSSKFPFELLFRCVGCTFKNPSGHRLDYAP